MKFYEMHFGKAKSSATEAAYGQWPGLQFHLILILCSMPPTSPQILP
jgi:hypothetical protein